MTYDKQHQHQQYKQYILKQQQPLCELAKDETDLRLKHLVDVINSPIQCLYRIIHSDTSMQSITPINEYRFKFKIKNNMYNNFLSVAYGVIKTKCEKGINFSRFKKEINKKTIWSTLKGYWFHSVPNIIVTHLWIPLLKDIHIFYNNIATNHHPNNTFYTTKLNGLQTQQYLHKKFLMGLLEAKCQINENSNPSGHLIQAACWKIKSFQQCINTYFDDNNNYAFNQWMSTKKPGDSTKTMSIPQIVAKCIKVHAQLEYKIFAQSIGINEDVQNDQHQYPSQCVPKDIIYNSNNNNISNIYQSQPNTNACYGLAQNINISEAPITHQYKYNQVIIPTFPLLPIYDNNMKMENMRQFQSVCNLTNTTLTTNNLRNLRRIHYIKSEELRQNEKLKRKKSLEKHTKTMRNNIVNNWCNPNVSSNTYYHSQNNQNNFCPQCYHCETNNNNNNNNFYFK